MKRLVIILFLTSICVGDTYTSHQKPITDSTLDVGSSSLLWRFIYGDSFTDGTALWKDSALTGFASIRGEILTDGQFIISGGTVRAGIWHGTEIDISSYTNLIAGTNITLLGDTLNVDDAFLINDGDDTTTGILTASGFTTTGAVTASESTFGDGGTTDYTEFSDLGVMTMYGDARVGRHLVIGAASWKKGATSPTDTYENIFPTISFNTGQNDQAHYATIVPSRWDDTTDMVVEIHWQTPNVSDTGKVLWKFKYIAVKLGEDPAGAGTEIVQLSAGNHPQDEIIETYFTTKILAANLEREDSLGLMLWRNGTDGTDNLGEDAELIAVHIHYVMNQLGEITATYIMIYENDDVMIYENGDVMIFE